MARAAIDDFILGIEGKRWIRDGRGVKGSIYQVSWIVDEVFIRHLDNYTFDM